MFVFWYSHKRGKQVRLERESAESKTAEGESKEEYDGSDYDATDSDEGDNDDAAEKIAEAVKNDSGEGTESSKADVLNQPEPAQVPLPGTEKGEKGAALEAEKSVGV